MVFITEKGKEKEIKINTCKTWLSLVINNVIYVCSFFLNNILFQYFIAFIFLLLIFSYRYLFYYIIMIFYKTSSPPCHVDRIIAQGNVLFVSTKMSFRIQNVCRKKKLLCLFLFSRFITFIISI